MNRIIILFLILTISISNSSEMIIDESCVVGSLSDTCTTSINVINNSGTKKACIWKVDNNLVDVKSCHGSSLQNWSYNWTQTTVEGDTFELRLHDNWPSHDESGYMTGTLTDSISVIADYGQMSIPSTCTVGNPEENCTTIINVDKRGAKKTCLWKVDNNGVEIKSCHGSSLQNWSYNWTQTTIYGDNIELRAHDNWPTHDQAGYLTGLLLDSKTVMATLNSPPPVSTVSSFRGGTNYHWFYHKFDRNDPNDFPASASQSVLEFGIIKNYHRKFDYNNELVNDNLGQNIRDIVINQLDAMFTNGQRRLRVGIWHSRNESNSHGTFLNSKNKLVPGQDIYIEEQYLQNIELFMRDIKDAGFEQVMFSFYPNGPNRPELWKNWAGSESFQASINATFNGSQLITSVTDPNNEPLWLENWRVIKQVKIRLDNSGLSYLVDLGNEAIPKTMVDLQCTQTVNDQSCMCPNTVGVDNCIKNNTNEINLYQTRWEQLLAQVWTKYINKYGNSDTVGYSVISRNANDFNQRSPSFSNVYSNGILPNTFSLHIYDGIWVGHDDAFGGLSAAFSWKESMNMNTKFIIGETDYNDLTTAQRLKAVLTGNRKLEFILQWPKDRNMLYRIDAPYDFSNYISEGF